MAHRYNQLFPYLVTLGLTIFMILVSTAGEAAIDDDIGAPAQEVYEAALFVLNDVGVSTQDENDFYIESDWSIDTIEEVRKLPFNFALDKKLDRRARYHIRLVRWPTYTEVHIETKFQDRRHGAGRMVRWKTRKATFNDHQLEKNLFEDILLRLEANRIRKG
ncbi:MAG: hypothetical protein Q8R76_01805 [Candidatus Omnitrophota bacterium]|nr:hypothetical protein [Candidatus Omnitrophota bacterium]